MTEAIPTNTAQNHRPDNHAPTEHQADDTEMPPPMFSPQDHTPEPNHVLTPLGPPELPRQDLARPTPSHGHPANRTLDPGSLLSWRLQIVRKRKTLTMPSARDEARRCCHRHGSRCWSTGLITKRPRSAFASTQGGCPLPRRTVPRSQPTSHECDVDSSLQRPS